MHTLPVIVTGFLLSLSPRSQAIWDDCFSFVTKWQTSSWIRRSCFTWNEVRMVPRAASLFIGGIKGITSWFTEMISIHPNGEFAVPSSLHLQQGKKRKHRHRSANAAQGKSWHDISHSATGVQTCKSRYISIPQPLQSAGTQAGRLWHL